MTLRTPLGLTSIAVLSLIGPVNAQGNGSNGIATDPRFQQARALFETWLDAKMDYEEIPAVSVAIVHDQDIVWKNGFGYAHRDGMAPATPQTMYSICSISKLFTSIAVMQLRDQGKVQLYDPVANHLPWFTLEQAYEGSPPITVEGLLTHSSGLPRETNQSYWTGPDFPFPTRAEIIEGLKQQETLYPASTYFQYSNLGLTLAGQIVEQASGLEYGEYIRRHILAPLGMNDTYPEIPQEHRDEQFATGYGRFTREGKREEVTFFQAKGIAPAAGFASTVEDLAKFASWQFRLLEDNGNEVLNANTLREMHRVHWVDPDFDTMWGLGFSVSERDGMRTVGHGGSCPGFRSALSLVPDKKMAGVVMINAMGTNPGEVFQQMGAILGPALESIEKDPAGATPPKPEFAMYEGLYESHWGEDAILRWEDGLISVGLPSGDPMDNKTKLQHVDGHTFRRVRDNGELGEAVTFVVDANGQVMRYSWHGNFSQRVRDLPSAGGRPGGN
jgi:CubicO group peptidase (beta-lactamase class C family)